MKRGILICMALVAMMVARADGKHTLLPGKGHIDVEKLNKTIDLNMDISQLSVSELRVLRNAFAARQGYLFMSSDLRGIFSATSWYDKVMNKRFWAEEGYDEEGNTLTQKPAPISYTKEEQAFIARLKAREDELKQQNFQTSGGNIVNVANLVNPFQLNEQNPRLMETLGRNGFAIVPANNEQMFHVYERNDYHEFPSFVTTDLYLQAFHMYFDCVLREVEQQKFIPTLTDFTQKLYEEMNRLADTTPNADMKAAAQYDAAFFAIGHALLTGEPLVKLKHPTMAAPSGKGTLNLQQQAEQEIKHVMAEEYAYSDFLEYTEEMRMPMFTYPMFRPRGHYTRNETLKHYFRGMMWLQSVPFAADIDHQLKRALVMAQVIGSNPALTKTYQSVAEPLDYLMGMPDNVTILQVYAEITKTGASLGDVLKNKKLMSQIRSKIEELALKQTRIVPKFLRTSRYKINLMPQRYMPDGEVLQEMVDYDNEPTLRDAPKGLDVLAAIGISSAERLLLKELNEQGRWDKYTENLNRMKQRMTEIDCLLRGVNPYNVWHGDIVLKPYVPHVGKPREVVEGKEGFTELINAYAPWEYIMMMPFALMPRTASWILYFVLMLASLGALFAVGRSFAMRFAGVDRDVGAIVGAVAILLAGLPIYQNFHAGVPVLLAAALMAVCLNRGWDMLAGVCWAFAMLKPNLGLAFAIPLLAIATGAGFSQGSPAHYHVDSLVTLAGLVLAVVLCVCLYRNVVRRNKAS